MKNLMGVLITVCFLSLTPGIVLASSASEEYRDQLLHKIELLQQQLTSLLQQQAQLSSATVSKSFNIYKSAFYDGKYEALYYVDGKKLTRRDTVTTRAGDLMLWNAFVEMVGEDFIKDHNVTEFRIFNDEDNWLSGYVDQKDDLSWIMAINRFDENLIETYNRDFNVELLLHEAGHIAFFADIKYEKDFTAEFWQSRKMERYEKSLADVRSEGRRTALVENFYEDNEDYFVTDYAATNATEDLVETFVEFVINDYPSGQEVKDDKIRFFYHYPELVNWRDELRQSDLVKNMY